MPPTKKIPAPSIPSTFPTSHQQWAPPPPKQPNPLPEPQGVNTPSASPLHLQPTHPPHPLLPPGNQRRPGQPCIHNHRPARRETNVGIHVLLFLREVCVSLIIMNSNIPRRLRPRLRALPPLPRPRPTQLNPLKQLHLLPQSSQRHWLEILPQPNPSTNLP